jgi:hypothetical protein
MVTTDYKGRLSQKLSKYRHGTSDQEAKKWLTNKIKNIRTIGAPTLEIGKMFMFWYDPKWKDVLPYYDICPLILVVDMDKKGFYGLNLHYLPPQLRAMLLDRLLAIRSNNKYDSTTYLKISYSILKATQKYAAFKPCFHRYLWSHVRSKFAPIQMNEWDIAIFLPLAVWRKEKAGKIWSDSRSMI